MATPDIFLSYNREDAARAKQFANALEAEGFSVWWDATLRSGENYDEVTEAALQDARAVVVLWSAKSVVSRWVRAEATEAERAGKLVPVMIEECKRPIMFELKQTAELAHWKGNRKDPAWQGFVKDLTGHIGRPDVSGESPPAEGPRPSSRKIEWQRWMPWAALIAVILAGAVLTWTQFSGSSRGVEVMVMSFSPAGTDPQEAAIANGITDELIVRLRRIPELRVVSGIGADDSVDADHRIDGSVRLNGNELRVSPRLLDRNGNVLWSDSFQQQVNDVFEVQERIASSVANTLSVSLDVGIESRDYGGTDNPEAYANYFKGRAYRTLGAEGGSSSFLERAVAIDPDYIKAWTELSYAYGIALYSNVSRQEAEELLAKMDSASARALELNPELWLGQAARGWYEVATSNFVSADQRHRLVAEWNDGRDPEQLSTLANFEAQLGRERKSLEYRRAMRMIDPVYGEQNSILRDLFDQDRYEEVISEYHKADSMLTSKIIRDLDAVFWSMVLTGRRADAAEFARAERLDPIYQASDAFTDNPDYFPDLSLPELRQWAERKYGMGGRPDLILKATLASYFDRQDLAMNYLRVAYEHPGIGGNQMIWHPALAKLRKTDAFVDWITERGFVDAWRKSGDWGDFCKEDAAHKVTCV